MLNMIDVPLLPQVKTENFMTFIFRTCKKSDVLFVPQQKEITLGKTGKSILEECILEICQTSKVWYEV